MDLCKSTYLRVPDLSILVWVCKIDIAPKMLHTTIAPQCMYELALTYIFDNSLSSKHTNAIIGKSLKIFWLRAWNEVMAYKWNTRAFFLCIYKKKDEVSCSKYPILLNLYYVYAIFEENFPISEFFSILLSRIRVFLLFCWFILVYKVNLFVFYTCVCWKRICVLYKFYSPVLVFWIHDRKT